MQENKKPGNVGNHQYILTQPSKTPRHLLLLYISLETGEKDVGRFSGNNKRLQKIDIRIYVSLDTYQIVFTGFSRNKSEVPLRQQSTTLSHVLQISVSLGCFTNDGENSNPPDLTIHGIKQTQMCIGIHDTPKMTGKYKGCTHMASDNKTTQIAATEKKKHECLSGNNTQAKWMIPRADSS